MTPPVVHPFLMGAVRGGDPARLLALAPADGDWEKIVADAAAHGLAPLLRRWLRKADLDRQLPEGLRARLEAERAGVAARNLLLAGELAGVLRALAGRGLPCAPLRGLALAERLHGDLTARPMGDIDLLARREHLAEVTAVLSDLGFAEMDRRPGFARAYSHTLEFFKDRHGWIMIEPHWTLAYPPFVDRLDMEAVWRRCVRGRVVGVETWLLPPEELLLHLCLHLAHRDESAPLLWLYELDRLVRQEAETLDWSCFLSLVRDAKLEPLLSQILGTARALLETPVPDRVLVQLARDRRGSAEARLARLVGGASRVDGKESLAVFFALQGLGAKLRYVLALLFPSPEFMRREYALTRPRELGPAYVRRVCHLSREGLNGVVKLLC